MNRRQFNSLSFVMGVSAAWMMHAQVHALGLEDLSKADASKALKLALEKGAVAAVTSLGVKDGFLGNEAVRIALPPSVQAGADLLRKWGQGEQVDALVTSMNRAAEAAVPLAKPLLVKAVKGMTVSDAKGILAGGDTAVTEFFANKTRTDLGLQFLPVVTKATEKVGLVQRYNQVAGRAAELGLMKEQDANIQTYVTAKALDGLFYMIGEEEKKIRSNPVRYGSAVLSKVFGALQ